jgi:hypothetical protein
MSHGTQRYVLLSIRTLLLSTTHLRPLLRLQVHGATGLGAGWRWSWGEMAGKATGASLVYLQCGYAALCGGGTNACAGGSPGRCAGGACAFRCSVCSFIASCCVCVCSVLCVCANLRNTFWHAPTCMRPPAAHAGEAEIWAGCVGRSRASLLPAVGAQACSGMLDGKARGSGEGRGHGMCCAVACCSA